LGEELRIPASWEEFLEMYHRHVAEGTTFYTHNDGQWRRHQVNLTFSYRLHQQKKKKSAFEEGE
jgi:hypothetical protein